METTARQDSTLVTYSSEDANKVDQQYGNGRFTCQINNANKATHAVKITPNKVMVPNVFPNIEVASQISVYSKRYDVVSDIVVTENSPLTIIGYYDGYDSNSNFVGSFGYDIFDQDAIFPVGVYTPTQYAQTFNTLVAANKKTSIDPINQLGITLSYNIETRQMSFTASNMYRAMLQESAFPGGSGAVQGYNIGVKVLDSQQSGDGVYRGGNSQFYTGLGMPLVTGTSTLTARRPVGNGLETSDLVGGQAYVQNFGPVVTLPSNTVTTPVHQSSVAVGFYNINLLLSSSNTTGGGVFTMNYDLTSSRVSIALIYTPDVPGDTTVIGVSSKLASRLGFTGNPHTIVDDELRFDMGVGELTLTATSHPHLGTTPIVYIAAREAAQNNMVASDSNEYNIIASVPMHAASYGQYASYTCPDIFLDDIDFRTPRCLSRIDFEVLDYKYQPLYIDPRFPVIVQLKVYHVDTVK